MTVTNYRGVKIRIQKGRDWGYLSLTVNGHKMGQRMGTDPAKLLEQTQRTVDHAIEEPDRYGPEWLPGHKGKADPTAWQHHRCA